MNSKDNTPDYKKIYEFVRNEFSKVPHFRHGPTDETYFTLRVYESAKDIIELLDEDIKKEQVLVASILHDVGKANLECSKIFGSKNYLGSAWEEMCKHPKSGVPVAREFLEKEGFSETFISEVCYLVEHHSSRGDELKEKSLELQVLQDADLIADIGFAGFIRPFLFCGKFSDQSVIDSIQYMKKVGDEKVSGHNKLNLSVSKSIAKEKMKFQNNLINEISKDIDSDLLF